MPYLGCGLQLATDNSVAVSLAVVILDVGSKDAGGNGGAGTANTESFPVLLLVDAGTCAVSAGLSPAIATVRLGVEAVVGGAVVFSTGTHSDSLIL